MPRRVVKVRIHRGDFARGENQLMYPERYNPQEIDRQGQLIGPGNGGYSGHIGLGGDEEWCILVLPDALANEYAEDRDMEIITMSEADTLREQWRQFRGETEERVDDPERIQAVRAKQEAGIALSQEDRDALDPNSDVPGIRKRIRPLQDVVRGVAEIA